MRHDLEYLKELSKQMDNLARAGQKMRSDLDKMIMLTDLRDYFIYLTLDALEDPKLARELVESFTSLMFHVHFHFHFLSTLGWLLRRKHSLKGMVGWRISRGAFEESWGRTRRELGL